MIPDASQSQYEELPVINVMSKQTAPSSTWGDNCQGWTLVAAERLHMMQERMPPQTNEIRHVHDHTHQFYYMLTGEALVQVADQTELLRAGEGVQIPPGAPHQLRNPSHTTLEFLVVSSAPPRNDRRDL
jgi:mannose-6-phosphate isomerase-like protein (cupin superfamily)